MARLVSFRRFRYSSRIDRVMRRPDFCKNFQSLRLRLIISTVSSENSCGNRARDFGGKTESATVTGTVRILFESSSVDSSQGSAGPSLLVMSC